MLDFKKFFTEEEVIKLTQDLVRIPSHKDVEYREKDVAEYIYNFLEKMVLKLNFKKLMVPEKM